MDEVIKRIEGLLARKAEWLKERQNVVVDQDDLRELLLMAGRSREILPADRTRCVRCGRCSKRLFGRGLAQQIADAYNEALDRIKDQSHEG